MPYHSQTQAIFSMTFPFIKYRVQCDNCLRQDENFNFQYLWRNRCVPYDLSSPMYVGIKVYCRQWGRFCWKNSTHPYRPKQYQYLSKKFPTDSLYMTRNNLPKNAIFLTYQMIEHQSCISKCFRFHQNFDSLEERVIFHNFDVFSVQDSFLLLSLQKQSKEPFVCSPYLKIHLGIRATRALLFMC